ncbi:hypothetical protein XI06_20400 [Bradyrhizobium sp. CCBAU 11434]|nr:hypothetical protein [Bradyrhizobium sp. CCBAU 11434]
MLVNAVVTKNTREVAATLLKLAKTSSDPAVAAGFIERAADLKERIDDEGLPKADDNLSPNIIERQ